MKILSLREQFVSRLIKYSKKNKNLFLLTGDLGFSVLEPFREENPKRFFNMGVSEQNMMGVAAGLALEGNTVFTYSIANFATSRCHEQVRNDICYHDLNVTIVATGGGLAYGAHGYTHHGIEDIAIMRCLPNMTIYAPSDRFELDLCFDKILRNKGPKYLRLARGKESDIYQKAIPKNTEIIELEKSSDITLLACGPILEQAIGCVNHFKNKGINIGLYSLPIISHSLSSKIKRLLSRSSIFITVEEHKNIGGFGSFISELAISMNRPPRIISCGVSPKSINSIGNQEHLRKINRIDQSGLIKIVSKVL
jgi:transketolase